MAAAQNAFTFDPATSFAPIVLVASVPNVLVINASLASVQSPRDLIAHDLDAAVVHRRLECAQHVVGVDAFFDRHRRAVEQLSEGPEHLADRLGRAEREGAHGPRR